MKRSSSAVEGDILGIEGVGAFVDKVGSKKRRRRVESEGSDSERIATQAVRDTLKDEVEERLEEILFGKPKLSFSKPCTQDTDSEEEESEYDEDPVRERQASHGASRREGKAAWEDEDDAEISVDISAQMRARKLRQSADETTISGTTYSRRLRSQYEKLLGQPEWACRSLKGKKNREIGSDSDSSDDDEEEEGGILQRAGHLLKHSTDRLLKGILDLKRMKDANHAKPAEAVVRALEFHPTANVVIVGGYHKTLDLFQVDGQTNPKIQSIHIQGFPISTAHFSKDGREVIVAGRKRQFFVYDMMAGKITQIHGIRGRDERYWDRFVVSPDNQYLVFLGRDGYMVLVSTKTKQWVGELKMNGNVCAVTFTSDSKYMLSTGSQGKVYVWDMSARSCVNCFDDEGCLRGTTIAVSPNSEYIACGSSSGVVNLYAGTQCLKATGSTPKPLKAIMNLTTSIDTISFNSTSELMMMASKRKKSALRVVHLASQTVFSNWPVKKTPLNYVSMVDTSPQSRYLAIGNARGRVLLYRFNHYSQ